MYNINSIPYMKCIQQKVRLPFAMPKKTEGSIIFINNKDFLASTELVDHNMFISTGLNYFRYYMDFKYIEKIGYKTVRVNYKDERKNYYKEIKDKFPMFKTFRTLDMATGKNLYFDLFPYNEIYFKYLPKVTLKKRIESYFNYIQNIVKDKRFSNYQIKTVFMDVDHWCSGGSDTINNPIMYLTVAYRRFFEIFRSIDMEFVFYTDKWVMKLNPSKCKEKEFNIFKREMGRMLKSIDISDDEAIESEIEKDRMKTEIADSISNRYSFVGDTEDEDAEDEIKPEIDNIIDNKVNDEIEEAVPELSDKKKKELEEKIKTKLETDKETLSELHDIIQKKKIGKSSASLKRDEELRKKQKQLKIENRMIDDYLNANSKEFTIPSQDVSAKVKTTNENVKKVRFTNFEKSYNENLAKKDTINIIQNLNNKSIPTYIVSMDIKDSSDELNYKDTYHVVLEDENRVRHNLTFDVPKFVDDKFLYLNGNRKFITKQLFNKPISKTGPDEVQVCTNYNKVFITRRGNKLSPKIEKFKKALATSVAGISYVGGDSSKINNGYKTSLEYDELSKTYSSIQTPAVEILFNQKEIEERLGTTKLKDNEFCIGFFKSKKPIIGDYSSGLIEGKEIVDFIVANSNPQFIKIYDDSSAGGKRFVYSMAKIMNKSVPLVLVLSYCEGLDKVLNKANVNYHFTDKRPTVTDNEGVIQFEDGYLVYDRYPLENSLLLNALTTIPTKSFKYEDMNDKDIYLELFDELYNARNLSNAFDSFYEFMIDPITKEVLEDMDYPTDFVSVMLCANTLLADNSYLIENNMNLYRVRSNEVVNALIHKEIADAYSRYRATANNNNPVKISIPKDAIIKKLLSLNTVEEFSTLNPIYESEKLRSITVRGLNGLNVEDAMTMDKRAYDQTMVGVLGISSSPDLNVGVVRKMTLEPNITGPRGYIDISENPNDQKDVNLFTVGELLTPLGVTHDDAIRTAMASKQSGHIIPVKKASPVLISNGVEQTIQYNLSKDFVIVAEEDGEVAEVNEQTGLVMVKYKSGKCQAIDTRPKVLKNSSSGFYTETTLKTELKKGDKVKKNDIMAYSDKFFSNDGHNGNRFNLGSLEKVAVMSSYSTYEDSTFVTKKLSEDMSSEIIMRTDAVIGKNANVDKMVKIGDKVEVGDVLIQFDTSYKDDTINKFLASVGDDLKEEVKSLSRVPIKSKYSGEIADIKIYSTVDIEDLSPSLKKIVSSYYTEIDNRKKLLTKYDKDGSIVKAGILFTEATGKITPTADGKLKGQQVDDGVLIEFYVRYYDPIGVGDKLTFYSALKSVIGEVIEEGYEPYSEFRPDEEISSFLGPSAVLARMTPSALLVMFTNKVLIELKRKLKDIYEK